MFGGLSLHETTHPLSTGMPQHVRQRQETPPHYSMRERERRSAQMCGWSMFTSLCSCLIMAHVSPSTAKAAEVLPELLAGKCKLGTGIFRSLPRLPSHRPKLAAQLLSNLPKLTRLFHLTLAVSVLPGYCLNPVSNRPVSTLMWMDLCLPCPYPCPLITKACPCIESWLCGGGCGVGHYRWLNELICGEERPGHGRACMHE